MCHQSVSLTARELERQGIVSVVIGSALDIVTRCNVPRYLHNNLPLGNPLGPPEDRAAQRQSVVDALALAKQARQPEVRRSALKWPGGDDWIHVYNRVDESNIEELRQRGEENRRARAADKAKGLSR